MGIQESYDIPHPSFDTKPARVAPSHEEQEGEYMFQIRRTWFNDMTCPTKPGSVDRRPYARLSIGTVKEVRVPARGWLALYRTF